jgi:hypothetical protein
LEEHMKSRYSYKETLGSAEKIVWRDIIGADKPLDFKRPFLLESLARVDSMDFLTSEEKLVLNQIRGYSYIRGRRYAPGVRIGKAIARGCQPKCT